MFEQKISIYNEMLHLSSYLHLDQLIFIQLSDFF